TSRRAQLPRLLEREYARRIGTGFGLRRIQIAADRLKHEVGASVPAAGKAPIGRLRAQLLHPLNEVVSFGIRIEYRRGPELQRQLASSSNRFDGNNPRGSFYSPPRA